MSAAAFAVAALVLLGGCAARPPEAGSEPPEEPSSVSVDSIAESYVKLVLAVGRHDPDYVDAYHGPAAWREEVEREAPDLDTIGARAAELIGAVVVAVDEGVGELPALRRTYLRVQLGALAARVRMLTGERLRFDEESKALYDAVAPRLPEQHFERLLGELEPLLPGPGEIVERYHAFRDRFVIPPERLDAVFRAAIAACRERTQRHLELPAGESFEVEYVTGKSWSAYNWYKGGYHSVIEVNTDLPIHVDRAIDLACHEGYPGHHVYNVLLEQHLLRGRGWVEFSVYPLFSPQSLIAEGTANYGIAVAFPAGERVVFERDTLFPLAGLDVSEAERYYAIHVRAEKLAWAGNEAARRYLDGEIDGASAERWLMRYALMAPLRAAQRVRFIDQYRSYVINYNVGQEIVGRWVEARAGGPERRTRIWEEFGRLLSSPRLPSGLETPG